MVADYARLSILEVQELDYLDYLILKRDAFIFKHNQTPEGREYLDNAYRLELVEPDRKALKRRFGKEG